MSNNNNKNSNRNNYKNNNYNKKNQNKQTGTRRTVEAEQVKKQNVENTKEVEKEIEGFLQTLSRADIIRKSLDNYGYLLIAPDMKSAIHTANEIASEHLEIITKNPFDTMTRIQNAGAIFLGEYSSEPLGDYFAGPNHVLPTNGTAKFFSPLNVDDFIKKSSVISYSREALEPIHKDIIEFATAEHLTAHANSIAVRFEDQE